MVAASSGDPVVGIQITLGRALMGYGLARSAFCLLFRGLAHSWLIAAIWHTSPAPQRRRTGGQRQCPYRTVVHARACGLARQFVSGLTAGAVKGRTTLRMSHLACKGVFSLVMTATRG